MSQQQQKESGVCILDWEEGEFPLNVGKPSVQIHPRTSQHLRTRHKFAEASCSHRGAKMKPANSQGSPLGEATCAPIQVRHPHSTACRPRPGATAAAPAAQAAQVTCRLPAVALVVTLTRTGFFLVIAW